MHIVTSPCCEHCGADLSLRTAGDFVLIIASFNPAKRVFQDVASQQYMALDDEGTFNMVMTACSLEHAQIVCPTGDFIVRIDRGEPSEPPVDSWSKSGENLGRFWLKEAVEP